MVFPNKHDEDWYWLVEILYRNIEILFPMKEICKSCLLHEPWVDVFSYIFFLIWLITAAYAWSAFLCNAITYSRNISGVHGFPSLTVRYMPLRSRCFHLLKVSFFWQLNNLQSQSKLLGHFRVSLSPQCWCTRFGDRTAINNFERDKGSTRRKQTAFGLSVPTIFVWDCSSSDFNFFGFSKVYV